MALSTTVPGSAHRGTRRVSVWRRVVGGMVGVSVPAEEEPAAESEPQTGHETEPAAPDLEVSATTNGMHVEVAQHPTSAQLNPDPVFVAVARTVLSALNHDIPAQQAALDLHRHLAELDSRLAQARRQSRNRVQAEAMGAGLFVSHEVGAIPAPGTDAFDELAARQAGTMRQRALHTVADPGQTGIIPVIKPDEPMPAPAPSYTGRVIAGGVVHRQDPLQDVAFPACVLDEEKRAGMLTLVREGALVYLPTQREVTCQQLACSSAVPAGKSQDTARVEVSTVVVAGPQFPFAPFADKQEQPSPVHQDGDAVEPPVPDGPVAESEKLPRRGKTESVLAGSDADEGSEAAE